MSFKTLSTGTALFPLVLCIVLITVPQVIYWLFGLEGNDLWDFLAKRAGVLFTGFAVLCYLARQTTSTRSSGLSAHRLAQRWA